MCDNYHTQNLTKTTTRTPNMCYVTYFPHQAELPRWKLCNGIVSKYYSYTTYSTSSGALNSKSAPPLPARVLIDLD